MGSLKLRQVFPPVSGIPDLEKKINAFIAQIRSDGTLDNMFRRWLKDDDTTMPVIDMPADPKLHLTVGTSGTVPPFSYYVGTELNGYGSFRFKAQKA